MMRALCAVFLLALGACADVSQSPVASLSATSGGTGVYAALPDTFQNRHIGTTIFNNQDSQFSTRSWRMNEFSEREVAKALQQSGVKNVAVITTPTRAMVTSPAWTRQAPAELNAVFAAARTQSLGQVMVLEPGTSLSQINNRPGALPPYGYFSLGALGNIAAQFEYVDVHLVVYDVRTQKRTQTTPVATKAITSGLSLLTVDFAEATSGVSFKPNAASYSGPERRQLETTVKRLFRESLAEALRP